MKKIFSSLLFTILLSCSICFNAQAYDHKLLSIRLAGCAVAVLGLYNINKGLEQTCGEANPQSSCTSSLVARLGGIMRTIIGTGFTGIGLAGILGSDALVNYINDEAFKLRLQKWANCFFENQK